MHLREAHPLWQQADVSNGQSDSAQYREKLETKMGLIRNEEKQIWVQHNVNAHKISWWEPYYFKKVKRKHFAL